MTDSLTSAVTDICAAVGNDRTRLMDIVRDVQAAFGCVNSEAMDLIGRLVDVPRVEVESTVSFYAFLSKEPKGKVVIRLCNDLVDRMHGMEQVADALCDELGVEMGQTTSDGAITLETTACIGMCDQAPAALVNDVVVTELNGDKARRIVRELREHMDPQKLVRRHGDGNNGHELVRAMVNNNLRQTADMVMSPINRGEAMRKTLGMTPTEVIRAVNTARLRGRGGAGFPCGMKWEFARAADGEAKYVLCNADEGEPGTFKDRVLLTERPDRIFAGMTIAGYAIGAECGIMYLRAEYAYLRPFLEAVLAKRREDNLLGDNILGKAGFNFDVRIQMGAGAYICGEETALISSCEGTRGDPKNRPPFPAQKGYLDCPSVINNCETLCCVTKILEQGPGTFSELGTEQSSGTKLLSVSGDCMCPGVYEVEFGMTLGELLKLVGAEDAQAVQVGGPSGQLVGPGDYGRTLCFDDLATGGSIIVVGPQRDLMEVVDYFMEFFVEESCGYCTPCRVGNVLLKQRLEQIMSGQGEMDDLAYLEELGNTVKTTSRCGLGQTSPNPILTSLKNFRELYEQRVAGKGDGFRPTFDVRAELSDAEAIAHRDSVHFQPK